MIFADIVDFTPYCDRHTPEDVVDHLQALVETWEEAALNYEIQKIKTIGDAFMAACGLLSQVDNPVLNCLRFGQEMIAATQQSPTGWNLRVGIHYGPVIGGVLGRRQYLFDLFGDSSLSGWGKAGWAILLIFVPWLGALIYLIARGRSMTERQVAAAADLDAQQRAYIQQVAGTSQGPADDIARAKELLDSGAIDQAEFEALKSKALA